MKKIKHDDDDTEQTRAKGGYGEQHFQALNVRLRGTNPIDLPEQFRDDTNQAYGFWILRPTEFGMWFTRLRTGPQRLRTVYWGWPEIDRTSMSRPIFIA